MPQNPNEVQTKPVSNDPNIENSNGVQSPEINKINKQEQKKQPAWKQGWEKIKNFRNNFNKENPNPQESKKQNKLVQLIKERFEKIGDFNRLSVKEKAVIIGIALVAILAIVSSTAFLIPSAYTVAGYVGPYLGFTNGAISLGGVTVPGLTSLAGASGTFGTYGLFNGIGAASLATTTAGMYGVQAGTAVAGTGLLVGGLKLAKQGDELIKKYMDKLPPRPKKVQPIPQLKPPEPIITIPQTPLSIPKKTINPDIQIVSPDNPIKETDEAYRMLGLGDLKGRYNDIMSSNQLTEDQKDKAIDFMLNSSYLRFKTGAKDVNIDEAIEISLLTNNYEVWQKYTKEIGIRNGLIRSQMDLSRGKFEQLRTK